MKKTIIITTLLLFTLGTGIVSAQPGNKSAKPGAKCAVKLTEEQKQKLNDLRQQFKDDTYELRLQKVNTSQAIRMALELSNPDRKRLHQLSRDLSKTEAELRIKMIDLKLEEKKVAPELSSHKRFDDSLLNNRHSKGSKGGRGHGHGGQLRAF